MVDISFLCVLRSLGKLYCKDANTYVHVVSIVYATVFKVGCSRHFSIHASDPALRSFLVPIDYGEQRQFLLVDVPLALPPFHPPTLPLELLVLGFSDTAACPFQAVESLTSIRASASDATGPAIGFTYKCYTGSNPRQ